MDDRYHAIDPPLEGTCEWLLDRPEYDAWRDPDHDKPLSDRLLWLKANAGAGKSTLMKVMYENSREQKPSHTLGYFFNARSPVQALDNSFCGMLRSLLWRLLTYDSSLLSVIPEFSDLKQHRRFANAWHLNQLKVLFSRCLRQVQGQNVYIYIDALDECPEDQARDAVRFLEFSIKDIGAVRLLFSSRFCPFISHKGREIDMDPHNAPDIDKYIDAHLPSMIDGQSSQTLRNLLGHRSSGIFLWTVLAVDEVIKANDRSLAHREIQYLVEKIPPDLELVIEGMLEKIDEVHRSRASLIFNWVLLASDALGPLEVFAIIRFDSQNPAANDAHQWPSDYATIERAIRTYSGGLLEVKMPNFQHINRPEVYVQFIHYSVHAHLRNSKILTNHTSLAEFCVDYIGQTPGFGDRRLDEAEIAKLLGLQDDKFRQVCAYTHFFGVPVDQVKDSYHVLTDGTEDDEAPMIDRSNAGPSSEQCTQLSKYLAGEVWISDLDALAQQIHDTNDLDKSKPLDVYKIHTLPKHDNFYKSVQLLAPVQTVKVCFTKDGLARGEQVPFLKHWEDDTYRKMSRSLETSFPLLRRIIREIFLHLEMAQDETAVERLTTFLVVENPFLKMNLLRSMICVNNMYSFIDQIHERINLVDNCRNYYYYDFASSERSSPDWQNQAVVRLAAGHGLCTLLEKILSLSPRSLNVVDSGGWHPLDHALESGCISTSALLLQKGAKVDMKIGQCHVASAIMEHGTSFAEMLISHLSKGKDQENILDRLLVGSVSASKLALLECLIKAGANVNTKNDDGQDALIIASKLDNNHLEEFLDTLLRHGATPRCLDRRGRTALHYLSTRCDCKAIEILLKGKPDVNAVDRKGQTPLDFALIHENNDVAELLRLHGAISGSSVSPVREHDNQPSNTTNSSDEWAFESDQSDLPWDSDPAD